MYAQGIPFLLEWLLFSPFHLQIYIPFPLMTAVVAVCGNEWSSRHSKENQLVMESRINPRPQPRLVPRHQVKCWQPQDARRPFHSQVTLGRLCSRCKQGKSTRVSVLFGPGPTVCLVRKGIIFVRTETSLTLQHLHSHFGHTIGFVLVQPNGLRQHHLPKAALS